jgi:thiamine kinase-like enzyme
LNTFDIEEQPIHGDVHPQNIFVTPSGILWPDFEAASYGPVEWDICGLICSDEDYDRGETLLSLLGDFKSFCVSVWCWDLAHVPEKLEAAQYHLARLKARYPQFLSK